MARPRVHIEVSIQRYCAPAQRLVMAGVSTAGALITGGFSNIVKGDEVILGLSGSFLVATVVWVPEGSFGLVFHRRMGIMLAREGLVMNHKKLLRLYRKEDLRVRRRRGRKRAMRDADYLASVDVDFEVRIVWRD